jgi:light-regulated signal transduction histidine kinase (bacteriophytochrome)
VGYEEHLSYHVFRVRDNGIGIREEDQKRIFNLFQRLHTQEEYSGIGAGLAKCRRIVESMGGRIWVDSHPDDGSTFYFTYPKDKMEET